MMLNSGTKIPAEVSSLDTSFAAACHMEKKSGFSAQGFWLGPYKIDTPVILAPLSGLTDKPFRDVVQSIDAGYVVSEMIAGESLLHEQPEALRRLAYHGQGLRVVQLAGYEPELMNLGAKICEDAGADVIDINFGCPARRVSGRQSGSALMRQPERAFRIISAVVKAVQLPVTVKMRLGWDWNSLSAAQIAKEAESLGVQLVAVHGRTRCQFYDGQADWQAVRDVVDAVKIPVLVNGDIHSFQTAQEAIQQSGAHGVMIGRAALGQPWLLREISAQFRGETFEAPSVFRKFEIAKKQYILGLEHYGEEVGVRHLRKHLQNYVDRHFTGDLLTAKVLTQRHEILRCSDWKRVLELIDQFACS